MALVKTSALPGKGARARSKADVPQTSAPPAEGPQKTPAAKRATPKRGGAIVTRQAIAERIGAATEQMASGVTQAASAADQLRSALEQIASASEEAAGGAQESLAAITNLTASFARARNQAEGSRGRVLVLQRQLSETASDIDRCVAAVEANAQRQLRSVAIITTLEEQAASIGRITLTVADIADQTGLLALNAALEATRAGDHGRGFAVVADEVRFLAETSENQSRDVQQLAERIGSEVRTIAARIRDTAQAASHAATAGRKISAQLDTIRVSSGALTESSQTVLLASVEADIAAMEAQKGAESVASAAEQQAAAATQAQRAVQQQAEALAQSRQTAESLAALAQDVHAGQKTLDVAAKFGAAAEELSATVQELSGAAGEILIAVEEIGRGAQIQAAATQQSSSAMAQIHRSAAANGESSRQALDAVEAMLTQLHESRNGVTALVEGVAAGLSETATVLSLIEALEDSGQRIGRIVDGLALLAVQTTMLAVSGSVEAARAGASGQGFAVVSTDIRRLAREAASNADSIKDLVDAIQAQVTRVRRDVEQIATLGETEVSKNQTLGVRLGEVEESATQLQVANQGIWKDADAILQTVGEILAGTQQIAAAAQESGSAGAQAAASARQQAQGAEDLAAAIEEIASLADELQKTGS
jgi:methyl-accepting chemotaxis protein